MKHLDENYTISFYSQASTDFVTTIPSSSIIQNVTTQSVSQSFLNNYTWVKSTGSVYSEWNIISGTAAIASLNPNNADNSFSYSQIGSRIEIRGDEIFTNVYREAFSEENNGVAIYRSSSSGYPLIDYINVPTSSISNGDATRLANEFTLDGNYLAISARDTSADSSKLHIFKSSSSGWQQDAILTTSSYNSGSSVNDSSGDNAFITSVIKGNRIFANGFYSGYYNRFVAFFKSSSVSGWSFEDEVQVGDSSQTAMADTNGSLGISGVCTDFDGYTAVLGSKQGDGSEYWHNGSGKVHIIESSSSGWGQTKKGLLSLGLTNSVARFGDVYGAAECRTWNRFGYKACVVSGNYIAAAAQGINESIDGTYQRQRHAVFILKSGSSGWELETKIEDPATNLILSHSTQNGTTDTEFGAGITLENNVLVINSPEWQSDWTAPETEGAVYVYVSTSAGGWTLDQKINNPYSGSVFQETSYNGLNMKLGYNSQGGYCNAGEIGFNSKPGLSGSILVLNAPSYTAHPDTSGLSTAGSGGSAVKYNTIYGAMLPLSGSGSFLNRMVDQYNTESVEVTNYITKSGGPVPFRVGFGKGSSAIKNQSPTGGYRTYKP